MAYDQELANRIRSLIGNVPGLTEKAMFGGLAFLVNGNMSVAASSKGGLLLRVEPAQTMALAKKPHAQPFEMRGKPMEGWLRVDEAGVTTDKGLAPWVELSVAFARSLPPKDKSKPSMKKAAPRATSDSRSSLKNGAHRTPSDSRSSLKKEPARASAASSPKKGAPAKTRPTSAAKR